MNPYGPPAAPQYQQQYPQHPQGWPAQTSEDEQHLNVLAICHFVYAGLLGMAGLFGVIYIIFGVVMAAAVASSGAGPAAAIGGVFAFIGGFITLLLWGKAVCLIISAMGMRRRRRRTFSFVIACLSCAAVPLGTVLGIFTILVLSRPSVQAMYAYAEQG